MNRHLLFKLTLPLVFGVSQSFGIFAFDSELYSLMMAPLFISIAIFLNKRVDQYEKLVDKRVASYKASLNEEDQKAFEAGLLQQTKKIPYKSIFFGFFAILGFSFVAFADYAGLGMLIVGGINLKLLKKLRKELKILSKSTGGELC